MSLLYLGIVNAVLGVLFGLRFTVIIIIPLAAVVLVEIVLLGLATERISMLLSGAFLLGAIEGGFLLGVGLAPVKLGRKMQCP